MLFRSHYFPPGMLNPWRSKHYVSEPSENSTSGNEDQDLTEGKRHKPDADREVGNHEVMKPTLQANPNPITIKTGSKTDDAEAPPSSGAKQTDDEDAVKVPHTDKLPPNKEASNHLLRWIWGMTLSLSQDGKMQKSTVLKHLLDMSLIMHAGESRPGTHQEATCGIGPRNTYTITDE